MKWTALLALFAATALMTSSAAAEEVNQYWPASVRQLQEQPPEPDESQVRSVIKDYHNAALKDLRVAYGNWLQLRGAFEPIQLNLDRIFDAQADLAADDAAKVELLQAKLELARLFEGQAAEMEKHPPLTRIMPRVYFDDFVRCQIEETAAYRSQIEVELKRAKGEQDDEKEGLVCAPLFAEVNATAQR
ncbi:hypothetical protein [Blastopirellula marina]|uniref:Uncharacterized protein n=1 Tax=Blastopirellula marina TaxID=124 RepID=A0A2S8GKT8_9BACT|nr:hypothetical protein [Blastopirellula marina]PQO45042.1 hypothetical protein C5Y93_16035 [Blastopirellula marina]